MTRRYWPIAWVTGSPGASSVTLSVRFSTTPTQCPLQRYRSPGARIWISPSRGSAKSRRRIGVSHSVTSMARVSTTPAAATRTVAHHGDRQLPGYGCQTRGYSLSVQSRILLTVRLVPPAPGNQVATRHTPPAQRVCAFRLRKRANCRSRRSIMSSWKMSFGNRNSATPESKMRRTSYSSCDTPCRWW